jgi:hypothetical protein
MYKTTKSLWRSRYLFPRANINPKWLRNAPGEGCMVFGAIGPPGGPLSFDAAESDDGGAEVLAESLIFAAPNGAFFGAKLSTIRRSKSQPKTCVRRLATLGASHISPIGPISPIHRCNPEAVPVDRSPSVNAFFPLGTAAKKWQKYPALDHDRLNRL